MFLSFCEAASCYLYIATNTFFANGYCIRTVSKIDCSVHMLYSVSEIQQAIQIWNTVNEPSINSTYS